MTEKALEDALKMLRRQGVKSYVDIAGGGFEVEFWPEPPKAAPVDDAPSESDTCKCGHATHEHGSNGLCLRGCDPLRCSPEEKAS